jgi:hypothetical protein
MDNFRDIFLKKINPREIFSVFTQNLKVTPSTAAGETPSKSQTPKPKLGQARDPMKSV